MQKASQDIVRKYRLNSIRIPSMPCEATLKNYAHCFAGKGKIEKYTPRSKVYMMLLGK